MQDQDEMKARDNFDKDIEKRLGTPITETDLQEIRAEVPMPEYELYEDNQELHAHTVEADKVTPEDMDNYAGAQVTLPIWGKQRAGKVQ